MIIAQSQNPKPQKGGIVTKNRRTLAIAKPAFAFLIVTAMYAVPVLAAQTQPSAGVNSSGTNAPTTIRTTAADQLRMRGLLPISSWTASAAEAQYLNSVYSIAEHASMTLPAGPNRGYSQREIEFALASELSSWVGTNSDSAWAPGVRMDLGRRAELRCSYATAMSHFRIVWSQLRTAA